MGYDILNNHEHYQKFVALQGFRPCETSPVTPYLLEERVRVIISKADRKILERVAENVYGSIGYRSADIVSEMLLETIKGMNEQELKRFLRIRESRNELSALLFIMNF